MNGWTCSAQYVDVHDNRLCSGFHLIRVISALNEQLHFKIIFFSFIKILRLKFSSDHFACIDLHHMIVDGMKIDSHVVSAMVDDLAQRENIPDSVVISKFQVNIETF